jgi:hypothetical protein
MNASIDTLNRSAVSQVPLELLDSIEVGIAVLDRNFTVQVWNKFLENHSAKNLFHTCTVKFLSSTAIPTSIESNNSKGT